MPRESLSSLHQRLSERHISPWFLKEKKSAGNSASEMGTASKGNYKPIYPTLDEFRETPVKTKKSTEAKEAQSPVAILPEKVFEMTSNVFKSVMNSMKQPNDVKENMQKNIDETLWSISRTVFGGLNPSSTQPSQQSSAPPPVSSTPPPASHTPTSADQASGIATGLASSPQQPAFCPPPASCDAPPMTSGNTLPLASHTSPSAPAEPLVVPNSTTPASNPTTTPPQPFWTTSTSQPPKAAPSAAAPGSAGDVPVFAFPDPRFTPPSLFAPPMNSGFAPPAPFAPPTNRGFLFNIPPQSATVGTNTPNVMRTLGTPFFEGVESVAAPVVNCSAEPTNFEGRANVQKPCSAGTNMPVS